MPPQYIQGTICSTMSWARCHGVFRGRSGCILCPVRLSRDSSRPTRNSKPKAWFCHLYLAFCCSTISYDECWWNFLLPLCTRPNFGHNCHICDNRWLDYHCCFSWRFSLYFGCSGWGCFFAYSWSPTRRKCRGVSTSCLPRMCITMLFYLESFASQQTFRPCKEI